MNRYIFLSSKKNKRHNIQQQFTSILEQIQIEDPDIQQIYDYLVKDTISEQIQYSYEDICSFITQNFNQKNSNELLTLSVVTDKQKWNNMSMTAILFQQLLINMQQQQYVDLLTIQLLREFLNNVAISQYKYELKEKIHQPLLAFQQILTEMILYRNMSDIKMSIPIFQAFEQVYQLIQLMYPIEQSDFDMPKDLIQCIFKFLKADQSPEVTKQLLHTLTVLVSDCRIIRYIDTYTTQSEQTGVQVFQYIRQIQELSKKEIYDQEIIEYLSQAFNTTRNIIGECHVIQYFNHGIIDKYYKILANSSIKPHNILILMYYATYYAHFFFDNDDKIIYFVQQLNSTNYINKLMSARILVNVLDKLSDQDIYYNYSEQIINSIVIHLKGPPLKSEFLQELLSLLLLIYTELSRMIYEFEIMSHLQSYISRVQSEEQEIMIANFCNQL